MLSNAVLLLVAATIGQSVDVTTMPPTVQKQIQDKLIGDWVSDATFNGEKITGEQTWAWVPNNVCVSLRSTITRGDTKTQSHGVMGWDGAEKALVLQMFFSDGTTGTTRWTQLSPSQWTGIWAGTYLGQKSESPAKLEFKQDSIRYEDTTNGKPWVSVAKRKPKKVSPSNYEKLKDMEIFIGSWEAKQDDGSVTTWTFQWAMDKNVIENQLTARDATGKMKYSNKGMLGWDAETRRITNWAVNEKGNPLTFFWQRLPEKKWETWAPDMKGSWDVTVIDQDTWSMGTELKFKRH